VEQLVAIGFMPGEACKALRAVAAQRREALELHVLQVSHGRHCHYTLSLANIDCYFLGIYTVFLLSLLSFSVKLTVSPLAAAAEPWSRCGWRILR
jgi:hypothetical protein